MIENYVYFALILATLAYPFFVEDEITAKTIFWAVILALLTPVTTVIYALNHKTVIGHRQLQRRRKEIAARRAAEANEQVAITGLDL